MSGLVILETTLAIRDTCLARPAFAKALEDQMQTFRENEPA